MDIKALAFDTGGTVLDWHGGLVAALSRTVKLPNSHWSESVLSSAVCSNGALMIVPASV